MFPYSFLQLSNQSCAIQEAVLEKLDRLEKNRHDKKSANLNSTPEQSLYEEGFEIEIDEGMPEDEM